MKRSQIKTKKWKKIVSCTAITLVLACVFVVGFFAIKTGSIFGMFSYGKPYVETKGDGTADVVTIPDDKLKVTGQEDYSSVLTSSSTEYTGINSLPEIPEANSAYDKGTEQNPLVILEVVPELSQQSISYFATSKEDGLPFDPLEMSMRMSKDQKQSYIHSSMQQTFMLNNKHIKSGNWKAQGLKSANLSWLTQVGGIFSGNNFDNLYQIYDYDHTVTDSSRKTNGEDYDFSNAPLLKVDSYYTVEMKKGSTFVEGLSQESNGGSYPTIASLYDGNAAFKEAFVDKDGQEIPREVIDDDRNWAWNIEADSDNNKQFTISVTGPTAEFESDYAELKSGALDQKVFLERYKDVLSTTDAGTKVSEDEFARTEAWSFNDAEGKYKGYFVYVGKGNGKFNLDVNNAVQAWSNDNLAWIYVEDQSQLPSNGVDIWPEGKLPYEVSEAVNNASVGQYFKAERFSHLNSNDKFTEPEKTKTYKINYKYEGYKLKFQYIGIKWNDVLKRMLINFKDETDSDGKVTQTADQQYDNYHIKIVTVTPAMINEMDKNDTEDTLDYIERADMFYISSYYGGKNGTNADQVNNLRNFFWKYVDPDKETALQANKDDVSQLVSFEENDLEWSDCMKIIKRLSGDAGLAMMFSKQMGFYLDDGTDKVCNLIYDSTYKHDQKASLCNLAKLYLVSTMFDLSASTLSDKSQNLLWTFMDNVYGNIKQVKLSSSAKAPDNTAQYTGYYKEDEEGVNAACGSHDTDSKYTYLWNLYSFIPYVTTASEDALYSPDGTADMDAFVEKYGFLSSSLRGTYPESTYGHVNGNISDKGYRCGLTSNNNYTYTSITGTRDPLEDFQNVTIVMPGDMEIVTWQMGKNNEGVPGTFLYGQKGNYNAKENLDNKNFTIIDKGVMSRIAVVLFNILQNAKAPAPTMKFNVDSNEDSKKYYQKMSNSSVLIDFNPSASYNENRSKEKNVLKLFCTLNNSANRENSIITSIKMVDPNDSSKPAIPINTIYNYDGDVISKEANIGFSQSLPTPKKYSVEFITGYKVTSNNAKYSFMVPFKLSDWQKGYTQIRIDWVARSSRKVKGEFIPYQNPSDPSDKDIVEAAKQYAEVDIGERELFDLE